MSRSTVDVVTLLVLQTAKYVFPRLQSAESLMELLSRMATANQIKNLMGHFRVKMAVLVFPSQSAKSSLQQECSIEPLHSNRSEEVRR